MSKKNKRDMTPEQIAELEAEDERAMEAARELRTRREAVQGPAPIDREIHASLTLTRVFYPLFGCTIVAFLLSRLAANIHIPELETVTSIAATLLFLTSFVVWFISRHQAKKLTREQRGE